MWISSVTVLIHTILWVGGGGNLRRWCYCAYPLVQRAVRRCRNAGLKCDLIASGMSTREARPEEKKKKKKSERKKFHSGRQSCARHHWQSHPGSPQGRKYRLTLTSPAEKNDTPATAAVLKGVGRSHGWFARS